MFKNDLHPPLTGPDSDPVLFGVAAGLAELFPPVVMQGRAERDSDPTDEDDAEQA